MNDMSGIPKLEDIIDRLSDDLRKYSKSGSANPKYIDKQNKLIEELIQINNNYVGLLHYELWLLIEENMAEIERKDKSINAHQIKIITGHSEYPFSSFVFKISFNNSRTATPNS